MFYKFVMSMNITTMTILSPYLTQVSLHFHFLYMFLFVFLFNIKEESAQFNEFTSAFLFFFFSFVEVWRASAPCHTKCGYRQMMTFTRPLGTEWRSPRRITRTNGMDIPTSSRMYSRRRPLDPSGERFLSFFFFCFEKARVPFSPLHFLNIVEHRGTVNNARVVALLLQTFARRYGRA